MIAHLEAVDELELVRLVQDAQRAEQLERMVVFAEQLREEAREAAIAHEDEHRRALAA